MPGNRRGNDLKESAPVSDDRAHASTRPSRGEGRRNSPLVGPVAEHEKPREIGGPDVVRIDGIPASKAGNAGGPPSPCSGLRLSQCGSTLFVAHDGKGLGAEQPPDRHGDVRTQVSSQSHGDIKGRGIGPFEGHGGPVGGGGADGIGIHAPSVCEPSDSCARTNRTPAGTRNDAPMTRPRQSADLVANDRDS